MSYDDLIASLIGRGDIPAGGGPAQAGAYDRMGIPAAAGMGRSTSEPAPTPGPFALGNLDRYSRLATVARRQAENQAVKGMKAKNAAAAGAGNGGGGAKASPVDILMSQLNGGGGGDSVGTGLGSSMGGTGQSFDSMLSEVSGWGGDPSSVGPVYANGGPVRRGSRYAEGGEIDGPGTGTSDDIPAMIDGAEPAALSDGENVITAKAVIGAGVLASGQPDERAGHDFLGRLQDLLEMLADSGRTE